MRHVIAALVGCAIAAPAAAQDYPVRPIKLVIPFAAGGVSDIVARAITEQLSRSLGQPVVIENKGGAGGTVAAEMVARAAPDGYTLMLGTAGNLAMAPSLYKQPRYDPQRDLVPVALVARSQFVLVTNPALPAATVSELIALAKAKPGGMAYGSSGAGAPPHLAAELFKSLAQVDVVHVPYKGSAPMLTDLMSGQTQFAFDAIATGLPHVQSGRLKALATTGASRSVSTPNLPTMVEAGLPDFELTSFYAVVAPAGTPSPIVRRLSEEVVKAAAGAEARDRLMAAGLEPAAEPASRLDQIMRDERKRFARIIETAKIAPE